MFHTRSFAKYHLGSSTIPLNYDQKIVLPETNNLEYKHLKTRSINTASIMKTICAYLNGDGGKIIIGVTDDLIVKGYQFQNEKEFDTFKTACYSLLINAFKSEEVFTKYIMIDYEPVLYFKKTTTKKRVVNTTQRTYYLIIIAVESCPSTVYTSNLNSFFNEGIIFTRIDGSTVQKQSNIFEERDKKHSRKVDELQKQITDLETQVKLLSLDNKLLNQYIVNILKATIEK